MWKLQIISIEHFAVKDNPKTVERVELSPPGTASERLTAVTQRRSKRHVARTDKSGSDSEPEKLASMQLCERILYSGCLIHIPRLTVL